MTASGAVLLRLALALVLLAAAGHDAALVDVNAPTSSSSASWISDSSVEAAIVSDDEVDDQDEVTSRHQPGLWQRLWAHRPVPLPSRSRLPSMVAISHAGRGLVRRLGARLQAVVVAVANAANGHDDHDHSLEVLGMSVVDWMVVGTLAVPIGLYVRMLQSWLRQWRTFDQVDLRRTAHSDWLCWPLTLTLFPVAPMLIWLLGAYLVDRRRRSGRHWGSGRDPLQETVVYAIIASIGSLLPIVAVWGSLSPGPSSDTLGYMFAMTFLVPVLVAAWAATIFAVRRFRPRAADVAVAGVLISIAAMILMPPLALLYQTASLANHAPAQLRSEYPVEFRLSDAGAGAGIARDPILVDGVNVGVVRRRIGRTGRGLQLRLDAEGAAGPGALTQVVLDLDWDGSGVGRLRGRCGARPCLAGNVSFSGYHGVVRAAYQLDARRSSMTTHDQLWWYYHPAQVLVDAAPAVRTVPSVGQMLFGRGSLAVLSRSWNEAAISAVFMNTALEEVAARCRAWFHSCLYVCRGIPGRVQMGCTWPECTHRLDPECRLLQFESQATTTFLPSLATMPDDEGDTNDDVSGTDADRGFRDLN